jgi:hypothetical protein
MRPCAAPPTNRPMTASVMFYEVADDEQQHDDHQRGASWEPDRETRQGDDGDDVADGIRRGHQPGDPHRDVEVGTDLCEEPCW